MPCTPMITMSTCSDRIACTATGPTSPSDGVRSPPVSTTVRSGRCRAFSTSATLSELVTTVRFAMSPRCRARVQVVLPAVIAMAMPGRISFAARAAIASFSETSRWLVISNPGSIALAVSMAVAPPCTLASSPLRSSTSRSRRTVMSDTPSSTVSWATLAPPVRRTSSRILAWRIAASTAVRPFAVVRAGSRAAPT